MRRLLMICFLIAGVFTISAFAQRTDNPRRNPDRNRSERRGDGQRGRDRFDRLDLDRDGYISRNEWEAGRSRQGSEKAFNRIDTDGDGRISRMEFDFFQQQKAGRADRIKPD